MGLAWYEKMMGAGRSGQVVSSDKLLNELQRLDCRFRQRGSHITFHHDETSTRGTIVYGTRKLWSQKTVATALSRIKMLTGSDDFGFDEEPTPEPSAQRITGSFFAAAAPVLNLPSNFITEVYQGHNSQLIVRDREYPQIGSMITPYDHPDTIAATIKEITRKKNNFSSTLSLLQKDEDFRVVREGDVLLIKHPVHPIEALLGPYDPSETQDPGAILEQCFDGLQPYADNQRIFSEVVKSRKLELFSESCDEHGVYQKTFISRRFQRGFGVRVELEATQNGHVADKSLIGFLDDVDKQFFDSIENFMKNNYGFIVSGEKFGDELTASHPMLKDLDFRFPRFDSLPKLRDIYAKRESLGEEAYINNINKVLEQRDDILELVSYGLIFSVEQMMSASDSLYDLMDEMQKVTSGLNAAVKDIGQDVSEDEEYSEELASFDKAKKSIRKKFKKMERAKNTPNTEYDRHAIKDQNHISSIKNQTMPESFPYGRVMSMPLHDADKKPMGTHKYMVIKGPDGKNMVVFTEDGMNAFRKMLADVSSQLPEDSLVSDGRAAKLKQAASAGYKHMMPVVK